ncbi:MAG: hypothetical protein WC695_07365 [Candidatus Omnitrophota bacterium]
MFKLLGIEEIKWGALPGALIINAVICLFCSIALSLYDIALSRKQQ